MALVVIFLAVSLTAAVAAPVSKPPSDPCGIIRSASLYTYTRLDFREGTTLKEALAFLYRRYVDIEDIEEGRSSTFVFEYRLPEEILKRGVSFQATNITMIQAIKRVFDGVPIALTFESGKLIFHSPTPVGPR